MVMMGMIMSVVAVDVFTMVMVMAVGIMVLMVVVMAIVAVDMAVKPVSGSGFAGFMGMGVGVSMIMNVLALLFLPENSHIHMCSRDPAFYGRFRFHLHARQTQSVHFPRNSSCFSGHSSKSAAMSISPAAPCRSPGKSFSFRFLLYPFI